MNGERLKPAEGNRLRDILEVHKMGGEIWLNVRDVAAMTGIAVSTLNVYRLKGGGPSFLKQGRSVRYRLSEVMAFIQRPKSFCSTSEASLL